MIPEFRQRFNANFTPKKYQEFLQALNARCGTEIHFRVCETPAFFPASLINTMARYGDELMQQLLGSPDYRRESDKSIPARWNVPDEAPTPLFVSIDFGLARDESWSSCRHFQLSTHIRRCSVSNTKTRSIFHQDWKCCAAISRSTPTASFYNK